MATTAAPTPRASLLSGLRTGGVRSTSNPMAVPQTASPAGSFHARQQVRFNEDSAEAAPEQARNVYTPSRHQAPMTAAVDGSGNRFMLQQQHALSHSAMPFSPGFGNHMQAQAQAQALQMQMMQMEIMRLQAIQYQAEVMAQAQRQQQRSSYANPPATAGPLSGSFESQMRRTQASQLRSQLGLGSVEEQVPMTASLNGKFGSRVGNKIEDESTRVISGGTSLGAMAAAVAVAVPASAGPSKADGASSWRRGGNNNSVLSGNGRAGSPSVRITPPPMERNSPPPMQQQPVTPVPKARPTPLLFKVAAAPTDEALPAIDGEDSESSSSDSSHPTTPSSGNDMQPPLTPREEASKRLFEGLGHGRNPSPVPALVPQQQQPAVSVSPPPRVICQVARQPIGPPSDADEIDGKNFATRIRKKAIGGLGALMGARERREVVEAF